MDTLVAGGPNNSRYVFGDGSVLKISSSGRMYSYEPQSAGARKVISELVRAYEENPWEGMDSDNLSTLRTMGGVSKVTPNFWSNIIDDKIPSSTVNPVVMEAAKEVKEKRHAELKADRIQRTKIGKTQQDNLPNESHYRERQGRGGQDMRRT